MKSIWRNNIKYGRIYLLTTCLRREWHLEHVENFKFQEQKDKQHDLEVGNRIEHHLPESNTNI